MRGAHALLKHTVEGKQHRNIWLWKWTINRDNGYSYQHFLNLATVTFANFVVSAHTLTLKQPTPLPPPQFTLNLTTVILYHNLPNCQLNRQQQIQNSVARAVVKAPKSTHITPTLKSIHWPKINAHIEYKPLSLSHLQSSYNRSTWLSSQLYLSSH